MLAATALISKIKKHEFPQLRADKHELQVLRVDEHGFQQPRAHGIVPMQEFTGLMGYAQKMFEPKSAQVTKTMNKRSVKK